MEQKTPAPTLEGDPLISILIPCFNEERNARETIGAALAQRYPNIEVIAINDGSSDNTAQVLQQLAQEQPRLRVIHLAENQGKAVALKAAQRRPGETFWSVLMAMPCSIAIPPLIWLPR